MPPAQDEEGGSRKDEGDAVEKNGIIDESVDGAGEEEGGGMNVGEKLGPYEILPWGQSTDTNSDLACPGGTLISNRLICPSATACR